MPQMYPLNWMILLIYFITIFFLFNIMNYFNPIKLNISTYNLNKNFKKNTLMNWKW
uniref:ATP synthase complex subunit 8 n=1 Tax=Strongylogaster xanthocera TaxID=1385064 RepID=A0A7T8G4L7_9HYME|nr:ATP synthase F0 subunit 8 [Strongylogaster xanthocera]